MQFVRKIIGETVGPDAGRKTDIMIHMPSLNEKGYLKIKREADGGTHSYPK